MAIVYFIMATETWTEFAQRLSPNWLRILCFISSKSLSFCDLLVNVCLYQPLKFILELPFSDMQRRELHMHEGMFEEIHSLLRNSPDRQTLIKYITEHARFGRLVNRVRLAAPPGTLRIDNPQGVG